MNLLNGGKKEITKKMRFTEESQESDTSQSWESLSNSTQGSEEMLCLSTTPTNTPEKEELEKHSPLKKICSPCNQKLSEEEASIILTQMQLANKDNFPQHLMWMEMKKKMESDSEENATAPAVNSGSSAS